MKTTTRIALRCGGFLASALVLVAAGCATVPSPEVLSLPASADAVRCGADALEGIGYVTREVEPGVVEGTSVFRGGGSELDRHVVELRTADGDTPSLVATVSRWRFQASRPEGDLRRRAVHQARPDPAEVEEVRAALEGCRRGG